MPGEQERPARMGDYQWSVDGVRDSGTFLQLFNRSMVDDPLGDPLPLFQLGLAVLFDKPIVVAVEAGAELPANLRRIADRIVTLGANWDANAAAIAEALREVQR